MHGVREVPWLVLGQALGWVLEMRLWCPRACSQITPPSCWKVRTAQRLPQEAKTQHHHPHTEEGAAVSLQSSQDPTPSSNSRP